VKKTGGRGAAVVLGGFLIMALLHAMMQGCFSLFLIPVTEDMGLPRSAFSTCSSVVAFAAMCVSPLMGKLLTGRHVRAVFLSCIVGLGLSYASYSLAQSAAALYLSAAFEGAFSCGAVMMPVSIIITNWFGRRSGTPMAAALAGSGLGGAVITPILTRMLAEHGWRYAFRTFGILMILVEIPVALFLMKPYPPSSRPGAAEGAGARPRDGGFPPELRRSPAFWIYLLGILSMCIVGYAGTSQLSAFLTDAYSPGFSAAIMTTFLLILAPSKLLLGRLYDRFGPRAGTLFAMGFSAVSMLMLLGRGRTLMCVMAACFALGNTSGTVSPPVLTAAFFGTEHYGAVYGVVNAVCMIGSMIGPPAAASVYDATGSYRPAWLACFALCVLSAACVLYTSRQGIQSGADVPRTAEKKNTAQPV
jgi:MFS family permease